MYHSLQNAIYIRIPASNLLQMELGDRELKFEAHKQLNLCHSFKHLKLPVPINYVTLTVSKLKLIHLTCFWYLL